MPSSVKKKPLQIEPLYGTIDPYPLKHLRSEEHTVMTCYGVSWVENDSVLFVFIVVCLTDDSGDHTHSGPPEYQGKHSTNGAIYSWILRRIVDTQR